MLKGGFRDWESLNGSFYNYGRGDGISKPRGVGPKSGSRGGL